MGCGSSDTPNNAHDDSKSANDTAADPVTVVDNNKVAEEQAQEVTQAEADHRRTDAHFLRNIHTSARKGDMLKKVPLLRNLSQPQRDMVGGTMVERKMSPREIIFSEGDDSDGLYVLISGEAEVVKLDQKTGNQERIVVLGKGDFFGESAINEGNAKRGATVRVLGNRPCELMFLERKKFQTLVRTEVMPVHFAKRGRIGGVRADHRRSIQQHPNSRASILLQNVIHADKSKTPAQIDFIYNCVKDTLLFAPLAEDHVRKIIAEMWREELQPGTTLIKEGDMGHHVYVLESGHFDVFCLLPKPGQKGVAEEKLEKENTKVDFKNPGDVFGDLALMYNAPRNATCICTQDGPAAVWMVDRFTFQRIARDVGNERLRAYANFLGKVELLGSLTNLERSKIAEALDEVEFKEGETVYSKGENPDAMYVIVRGEAHIEATNDEPAKLLKKGAYFGEQALLHHETRKHTVTASKDLWLLRLDTYAFALLVGPLHEIMEKNSSESKALIEEEVAPSNLIEIKHSDLKDLGVLGKGAFGFVKLTQHTETDQIYALKAVSKFEIVESGQTQQIVNEKNIMALINSPFCIKLYSTFQDADMLYFVMEPALGGELFGRLRACENFSERTARFYVANVILAFQSIHARHIIHRDLKLENLLVSGNGYLKLTDFGFAKKLVGRTWTLCGTPTYLAPEIINSQGHGFGVDWWTLGILTFEMLAGFAPFEDRDQMKMYKKITKGALEFPYDFSNEARSFIGGLLERKPSQRLGTAQQGGLNKLQSHPFFVKHEFDWAQTATQEREAPYKPKIRSDNDLKYFAEAQKIAPPVFPKYVPDGTRWDEDF